MPLLELTLQSTFAGQQIINRFNYFTNSTPAAVSRSFALVSAFGCIYEAGAIPPGYPPNTPFAFIRAMQSSALSYDFASVKSIYNLEDFYETPFLQPATGTDSAGDACPPFVAYGFRTGRVRGDIGRGYKRFAGAMESRVTSGGGILASFLTGAMQQTATALSQVLEYNDEGNIISFTPCVVGKERYVPNPARPDRYAYKYYDTEAEQDANLAIGISFDPYAITRSQVSRQVGRGR